MHDWNSKIINVQLRETNTIEHNTCFVPINILPGILLHRHWLDTMWTWRSLIILCVLVASSESFMIFLALIILSTITILLERYLPSWVQVTDRLKSTKISNIHNIIKGIFRDSLIQSTIFFTHTDFIVLFWKNFPILT